MKYRIQQDEWNELIRQFKELVMYRIVNSLQTKLTSEHGADLGELRGSIGQYSKVEEGVITIGMSDTAKYLEFGTPGQLKGVTSLGVTIPAKPDRKYPMYKEGEEWHSYLEDWASRKLGIKTKGGQFALARHIALYGTRPYPFIRTTFNNEFNLIIRESFKKVFHNKRIHVIVNK